MLLHQVEPFLVRAGGGHEERRPPGNVVGIRHTYNQCALRRRHHRQRPLHHLQRVQAPAVRGEHRPAGERRLRQHDPRAGQQGGARPVRGRLHQEMQGRHPHRLRGGTQVRVLHLAAGYPLQRHPRLLQGQAQEQQEVPAQDAAFLHQHGHQGHGLLLERVVEVHERLLRTQSHLPRAGQPQHRRRIPHQELAQLRIRLRIPDRGDHRPDQEHLPPQRHGGTQHLHRVRVVHRRRKRRGALLDRQPETAERPRELVHDRLVVHHYPARHVGHQPALHHAGGEQLGSRIPARTARGADLRQRGFLQCRITHQRHIPAQARTG